MHNFDKKSRSRMISSRLWLYHQKWQRIHDYIVEQNAKRIYSDLFTMHKLKQAEHINTTVVGSPISRSDLLSRLDIGIVGGL